MCFLDSHFLLITFLYRHISFQKLSLLLVHKQNFTYFKELLQMYSQDVVGGRWRIRYEKLTSIDHEKAAARPRRRWAMKMNGRFRGIRLPRCRKLNWRAFAILISPKRIAEMYGEIINRMKMMDDICPGIVFSGHWGLPVLSHSIIRM